MTFGEMAMNPKSYWLDGSASSSGQEQMVGSHLHPKFGDLCYSYMCVPVALNFPKKNCRVEIKVLDGDCAAPRSTKSWVELRHSMPKFCPKRLKSNQHPYPELQCKAWNVSCHNSCLICFFLIASRCLSIMVGSIFPIEQSGYLSAGYVWHGYRMRYKPTRSWNLMTCCWKPWSPARSSDSSWIFWASSMTIPEKQIMSGLCKLTFLACHFMCCQDHGLLTPLHGTPLGGPS